MGINIPIIDQEDWGDPLNDTLEELVRRTNPGTLAGEYKSYYGAQRVATMIDHQMSYVVGILSKIEAHGPPVSVLATDLINPAQSMETSPTAFKTSFNGVDYTNEYEIPPTGYSNTIAYLEGGSDPVLQPGVIGAPNTWWHESDNPYYGYRPLPGAFLGFPVNIEEAGDFLRSSSIQIEFNNYWGPYPPEEVDLRTVFHIGPDPLNGDAIEIRWVSVEKYGYYILEIQVRTGILSSGAFVPHDESEFIVIEAYGTIDVDIFAGGIWCLMVDGSDELHIPMPEILDFSSKIMGITYVGPPLTGSGRYLSFRFAYSSIPEEPEYLGPFSNARPLLVDASHKQATIEWVLPRLEVMFPEPPDLIFIRLDSENILVTEMEFEAKLKGLCERIHALFPKTGIVLISTDPYAAVEAFQESIPNFEELSEEELAELFETATSIFTVSRLANVFRRTYSVQKHYDYMPVIEEAYSASTSMDLVQSYLNQWVNSPM